MMSTQTPQTQIRVGLLGVGLMGSAMAHRLLDQGIDGHRVGPQTPSMFVTLEDHGGQPAETPSEVVVRAPAW